MTIRKKLILLYSGLLAVLILTFGLVVFGVIRSTWIEAVDSALVETATQVKTNSRMFPVPEFGSPKIGVVLAEMDVFRASGVLVQAWWTASGDPKWLGGSTNLGKYTKPLDSSALDATENTATNVHINDIEFRVLTSPIRLIGQERVLGYLQVAASLQTVNEATGKLSLVMLIGGGLTMLVSVMIGTWLSNQTLKHIEAITGAADSISTAKDLSTRLPWDGPMDELGRLTQVFNKMMDRIEHLFGVQQRLVADVSHELRTPLTAIRGNLDLMKRYGPHSDSLEAIESEAERMTRLVNDVLTLARADYGSLTLELGEVDLDTVMAEVYREAQVLAKDRDLFIKLAQLEPIRLMGNADRLKQLLLNLVSNAIKFTPDGGVITLRLRRENGQALLQVQDTGAGIEPEHLERIFDRFYQAEKSRAKTETGDGAGLGLAIAKWIAEAHDGSLRVSSTPGQGATFSLRLPVKTAALDAAPTQPVNGYLHRLGLSLRWRTPAEGEPER
jgi:signal transduction histidine kinase